MEVVPTLIGICIGIYLIFKFLQLFISLVRRVCIILWYGHNELPGTAGTVLLYVWRTFLVLVVSIWLFKMMVGVP